MRTGIRNWARTLQVKLRVYIQRLKKNNLAKSLWLYGFWMKMQNIQTDYIDIEDTVGVDENGNWYEGMLAGDNIHPTEKGSNVIAAKMMAVFSKIY